MSDIVDRAALALLNSRLLRLGAPLDAMSIEDVEERLGKPVVDDARKDVRAVVTALHEPTEAMTAAGNTNEPEAHCYAHLVWKDMIDEAQH